MVLRGRADHGRAADVDILDAGVIVGAFGDGLFKRVQVDHQQVDRADAVFVHRGDMGVVVAQGQQATVDHRVQGLDTAIHHLGKAGDLGDVLDL